MKGNSWGKVKFLGGDSTAHCEEEEGSYDLMPISEWLSRKCCLNNKYKSM